MNLKSMLPLPSIRPEIEETFPAHAQFFRPHLTLSLAGLGISEEGISKVYSIELDRPLLCEVKLYLRVIGLISEWIDPTGTLSWLPLSHMN